MISWNIVATSIVDTFSPRHLEAGTLITFGVKMGMMMMMVMMKMNGRVYFTWKCLPSCPWNTSTQIHPHTAGPPTWWSWSCWWYKNSQLMWHSNCKLLEPEVCVASSQDVSDDFAIRRCLVNIPIKTPEHQQILHVLHFYLTQSFAHFLTCSPSYLKFFIS